MDKMKNECKKWKINAKNEKERKRMREWKGKYFLVRGKNKEIEKGNKEGINENRNT